MKRTVFAGGVAVFLLWAAGAVFPAHRVWHSGATVPARHLCVSSLNLDMETDTDRMTKDVFGNAALQDCDILLLQEVVRSGDINAAEQFALHNGRHVIFAAPAPGDTLSGLAIISRYPIQDTETLRLKQFDLKFRPRRRLALLATVDTPYGPVRIMNTHLDTRINAQSRLEQLTPAIEKLEHFDGPRVIGGDLNTNNNAWIGHTVPLPFLQIQTGAVRELMSRYGFVTPFRTTGPTHRMFGMHLDWIYAKQLDAIDAGVERIAFSDHRAIWARFGIQ